MVRSPKSGEKLALQVLGPRAAMSHGILSYLCVKCEVFKSFLSDLFKAEEENEVDEITVVNILQVCEYFVHPIGCQSVHCVSLRLAYWY